MQNSPHELCSTCGFPEPSRMSQRTGMMEGSLYTTWRSLVAWTKAKSIFIKI